MKTEEEKVIKLKTWRRVCPDCGENEVYHRCINASPSEPTPIGISKSALWLALCVSFVLWVSIGFFGWRLIQKGE